jgi:LmbE family N-acetylglucosaminyl deacetylase
MAENAEGEESIVFFHAHPDDEAIFSGGTIARLSQRGHRVVVVMATSGGRGQGIVSAVGQADTATAWLPDQRENELREACRILGVSRLVLLRFEDSGVEPAREGDTRPFCDVAVEEIAPLVAEVLREERASALAIYDEGGIYGHPDHVHVHRVGVAAARQSSISTLYEMTLDREYLHFVDTHLIDHARESLPHIEHIGVPTVFVSTTVDVRAVLAQKKAAITAHVSQVQPSSSVVLLSEASIREVYGYEWFVRHGPRGIIETLDEPSAS